jgi:hypothetical protein
MALRLGEVAVRLQSSAIALVVELRQRSYGDGGAAPAQKLLQLHLQPLQRPLMHRNALFIAPLQSSRAALIAQKDPCCVLLLVMVMVMVMVMLRWRARRRRRRGVGRARL